MYNNKSVNSLYIKKKTFHLLYRPRLLLLDSCRLVLPIFKGNPHDSAFNMKHTTMQASFKPILRTGSLTLQ